jgi:hypothetical protein
MVLLVAAAALALALSLRRAEPITVGPKPTLLLLTSLPLIFNEEFSLQGGGSPALKALAARYKVTPISTTNAKELDGHKLLLMAHPLAQTAENLVDLDDWVRRGGRVLLLADPRLDWPSSRPLGDPLRPPPMFMDTGLLAHWGLTLDAPTELGPKMEKLGGYEVMTVSPGVLSGHCAIDDDGLVAHCRIGKGRATVIADADLLNVAALPGAEHNLDAILSELSKLAR